MSGTAPRHDEGPCDRSKACRRPFGHKGDCLIRRCAHMIDFGDTIGHCRNPARNAEESYCVRHESRETYERYVNPDGSPR